MPRRPALAVAVTLAAFASAASALGGGADTSRLIATVGPDFTIGLADPNGKPVGSLAAGTYELVVRDNSDIHNFAMGNKAGGGLFVDSGVEFVGERTFTITLVAGNYGFACSPHWQTMNGSLTVLAAASPPAPAPARRLLTAVVPLRGPLTLSPRRVAPGSYRITVRDRSASRNFRLVGPGVSRRTGKAFVGPVRWNVTLGAGTYRFGSEPALSGRLVVR